MGISIPNPVDAVRNTVDFVKDAGEAAVSTTIKTAGAVVDVAEGAVDLAGDAVGFAGDVADAAGDAAVGALKFQADMTKFALNKTFDGARNAANFVEGGFDIARRGVDTVTHPGFSNPPAAQGLDFAETKGASDIAYRRNNAQVGDVYQFPDGKQWRVADVEDNRQTGFRAVALQPLDPNDNRTIVAFSGTDEGRDWDDNIGQGVGLSPAQYDAALDFANKWKDKEGDNVILTGHSLGGGLASYAAIKTDLHATAVNSAPLALNNIGLDLADHTRITQYYVPGEVLSVVNEANPLDARPGLNIPVRGQDSILDPRSIGTNHALDHAAPDVPLPRLVSRAN